MDAFEEQFSFLAIVRVLASLRAKEANLRHRKVFYWRYFGGGEDPGNLPMSGVSELLPPRRQWARPNRRMRGGKGRSQTQILRDAIYRRVQGVSAAGRLDECEWGRRLRQFVEEVQKRVRSGDFPFERPRLWLRPKAVPVAGKTKCRCICCYEKLSDRVILALANKWLAGVVDPTLLDCCYSFRSTRKLTYNSAIRNLVTYRKAHAGRIYAADCDVMKFFDTVNHDVVRAAVERQLANVDGRECFLRLLEGYLDSYDLAWMSEESRRIAGSGRFVPDEVDVAHVSCLYGKEGVNLRRLGLPQGGALSGTLANLVLVTVDRAVASASIADLFYARYCDDILLVHPRKSECARALKIVRDTLKAERVPMHPVKKDIVYGRDYYEAKSKGPFAWMRSEPNVRYAMPWVSFLGCCVRYDGELRIRKETIEGHAKSMREECSAFMARLHDVDCDNGSIQPPAVGYEDAVRGLMYRLVDKGVGRITGTTGRGIGRCWLAAFPHVWESPSALSQLRRLDRVRTDLFATVKRKLGLVFSKDNSQNGDSTEGDDPSLYFGKPFSYAGIADRLVRMRVSRMRLLKLEVSAEDASDDAEQRRRDDALSEDDEDVVPPNSDFGRGFHGQG